MSERVCLVTGACGFTGSHLVKMLLARGDRVVATDLSRAFEHPKTKHIFGLIGLDTNHPNLSITPADLTDQSSVGALFAEPITHVFHTASLYDYSAPMEVLRRINVDGSVHLFDAALECKTLKRFVHWSTCGVFGKPYTAKSDRKCNIPFDESSSSPKNATPDQAQPAGTHLVNDYSVTKWEQEKIAWRYHREKGLPLTVVRPAPVYGPGSDYGHGGITLAINRGLVPFIPKDSRNYITTSVHVEDIAGFAVFIADKDEALGEDYNVIDDSIISYQEFLDYIALLLGRNLPKVPLLTMPMLRPFAIVSAKVWVYLEKSFNVPRIRILEVGSATYMSSSYWIANAKSKAAGYAYRYPDVRAGLRDTIHWFRDAGWLDPKYNPHGIWQENLKK
ncbi:MAG: NAD(P)-dependent oxidoreductase [Deltaproteobacteria bacterium]|nr:NAD(P)-dependent oxidoreductase [Deltaproteobacteria bacterium]MCB9479708.1 NAD(P)-dependent oxidoreductase [Deltaproteobacteria bacterium]MCB9488039.1 NAD(P)-dependent oxidoreductase [Deltaproteobacteria bacterium]